MFCAQNYSLNIEVEIESVVVIAEHCNSLNIHALLLLVSYCKFYPTYFILLEKVLMFHRSLIFYFDPNKKNRHQIVD